MSGRLALLLGLCIAGCTREHQVELRIDVGALEPAGAVARGLELRVHRGSRCPSAAEIAAGTDDADRAQSLRVGGPRMPVGDLAEGRWAFAVLARSSTCTTIGYGCSVVDLGEDTSIVVAVNPTATGAGCPGGLGCTDGLCGGSPTMCAIERCDEAGGRRCCGTVCADILGDPANCGTCGNVCPDGSCAAGRCGGCPEGGCLCGGRECVEACCGDVCVSTTADSANCGSCGHRCPGGLGCGASLCRPATTVDRIEIRAEVDPAACNPMLALVTGLSADGGSYVVSSQPVGDLFVLAGDVPWCGDAVPECELAAGVVMLLSDRNGSGSIEDAEVLSGPIYGVAPEGIIVFASRDHRPGDPALAMFEADRGIRFPEGVPAGIHAFQGGADGFLPVSVPPTWTISPCVAPSCDAVVDASCRDTQPSPIPL